MMIDLPAVTRALRFVPTHITAVAAGAGLYALVFAFQSRLTALTGAGDLNSALPALVAGLLAFIAFVAAMASWGRIALDKPAGRFAGLDFGASEGRLLWAAVLVFILCSVVLLTAALAVVFMIAALALINVDPEAPAPEPGNVDLFGLYGTGEWIVASVIFAIYGIFALWFFLRLAMAYPATLDAGQVQIMRVWPLSGQGRAVKILTTVVAAALPGLLVLVLFNLASATALGVYPASAQSASGEAGALLVPAPVFWGLSFVYGLLKAALVGAPVCAALCALYRDLQGKAPTPGF